MMMKMAPERDQKQQAEELAWEEGFQEAEEEVVEEGSTTIIALVDSSQKLDLVEVYMEEVVKQEECNVTIPALCNLAVLVTHTREEMTCKNPGFLSVTHLYNLCLL
jgi:hypothetical protein